jgi:hypothetical protein
MSSINTIRTYINDPDGIIFPDDYLYDCINDALLDMYSDCKPEVTSATLTLNTNDDIVNIPPTIMIPQQVIYQNKPYFITTQAELERWSRQWRISDTGQPKWFIRFDHNRIRVWPRPDQLYDMTIWGIGWPSEINSTNTIIDDDSRWRQAVEHKTASKLLELSRPDLAQMHESIYQENRHGYIINQRNYQGHNIRQLRPGTRYNNAQIGPISVGRWYK